MRQKFISYIRIQLVTRVDSDFCPTTQLTRGTEKMWLTVRCKKRCYLYCCGPNPHEVGHKVGIVKWIGKMKTERKQSIISFKKCTIMLI